MRKRELQKVWKQLDGACEAIEKLEAEGLTNQFVDSSAIVSLKNDVEELIQQKTRK